MAIPAAPPMAAPPVGMAAPPAAPIASSIAAPSAAPSAGAAPVGAEQRRLDLSGMPPVAVKKTVVLINAFVLSTTEFLNRFATLCESKLQKISNDIHSVDRSLRLLESKLASVPWLEEGAAAAGQPPAAAPAAAAAAAPPASAPGVAPPISGAPPAPVAPAAADAAAAPLPVEEAAPARDPRDILKDRPEYKKFIKLLGMGVPEGQIRQRLDIEGLDPAVLFGGALRDDSVELALSPPEESAEASDEGGQSSESGGDDEFGSESSDDE